MGELEVFGIGRDGQLVKGREYPLEDEHGEFLMLESQVTAKLAEAKRRIGELEEEVERLTVKPEEWREDAPRDCAHSKARCEDCRWPIWTENQLATADRDAKVLYHDWHGSSAPDDCKECQNDALRTTVAELIADGTALVPLHFAHGIPCEEWLATVDRAQGCTDINEANAAHSKLGDAIEGGE